LAAILLTENEAMEIAEEAVAEADSGKTHEAELLDASQ
jgi:hypothetical protein